MRKLLIFGMTLVLSLTLVGSAFASVTFAPATGLGFVGKGDVQTVLGYANAKIQTEANNLKFTYEKTDEYDLTLVWYTGPVKNTKIHHVSHTASYAVSNTVNYEARKMNQYTGFNLTSLALLSEDPTPHVGDPVVIRESDKPDPTDTTIESLILTSTSEALYVNGKQLTITPDVPSI